MNHLDKNEIFKELNEIVEKRDEKYSEWLKNIITIGSGMLAVLISLKTEKSENLISHYLFISILLSMSIGILTGILYLYSDVKILKLYFSMKIKQKIELLNGKEEKDFTIKRPLVFVILNYTCCFSFLIALILFVIYSIVLDS